MIKTIIWAVICIVFFIAFVLNFSRAGEHRKHNRHVSAEICANRSWLIMIWFMTATLMVKVM